MKRLSRFGRLACRMLGVVALAAAGSMTLIGASASAAPNRGLGSGTVLQTNLVSDLPDVAALHDANLVNPWGISESSTSPFWTSDNGAGVATLYSVPGANNTPISITPLVVSIPTPVGLTGGTPTGTVFNLDGAAGGFKITGPDKSAQPLTAATFLFATEDGTIVGWNPNIDPSGKFAGMNGVSEQAVIAVDKSGNNFTNPAPDKQTGAVYKGLAIVTSTTPIIAADANSTALLYASNFRAGTIDVYDAAFTKVMALPAGAFVDRNLPRGYAPFNVQVLNDKVFVTYAQQDSARHDDVAGPGHGFVDVFNLDGTPGLAGGAVRLISRGLLNSPWGLAIAPQGFAGLSGPSNHPVLLVGNFGNGFINAFDATTGALVGRITDPDGEPIQIDGLWALRVGNGGSGGAANTVYFTAGLFGESHGLFGSLSTVAPGTAEGPAEAQWVQANIDVVHLDLEQLLHDTASGAPPATIRQDIVTVRSASLQLVRVQQAFIVDVVKDKRP
jgi:uncharacterized protein (TIGR03118 family)